jgi:hypothetical protein
MLSTQRSLLRIHAPGRLTLHRPDRHTRTDAIKAGHRIWLLLLGLDAHLSSPADAGASHHRGIFLATIRGVRVAANLQLSYLRRIVECLRPRRDGAHLVLCCNVIRVHQITTVASPPGPAATAHRTSDRPSRAGNVISRPGSSRPALWKRRREKSTTSSGAFVPSRAPKAEPPCASTFTGCRNMKSGCCHGRSLSFPPTTPTPSLTPPGRGSLPGI